MISHTSSSPSYATTFHPHTHHSLLIGFYPVIYPALPLCSAAVFDHSSTVDGGGAFYPSVIHPLPTLVCMLEGWFTFFVWSAGPPEQVFPSSLRCKVLVLLHPPPPFVSAYIHPSVLQLCLQFDRSIAALYHTLFCSLFPYRFPISLLQYFPPIVLPGSAFLPDTLGCLSSDHANLPLR